VVLCFMNSLFYSAASTASGPCRRLVCPESPNLPVSFREFARFTLPAPANTTPKISALCALPKKSEKSASLFSITCKHFFTLFHSLQKSEAPSPFFSITSTLFARVPGGRPPSPPKTLSSFLPSARMASLEEHLRHRSGRRTGSGRCSLFAMSLFRHIVTSSLHPEKPYPAPYHLMAKRYRTRGLRVCFTNLRFKSILGVSGG
jgi:hypothetical protein